MRLSLIEEQQKLLLAPNYLEWQRRLVLPEIGTRILELGCGIGNFTPALLDREAVLAVDIDRDALNIMRKSYCHSRNVEVLECDVNRDEFLSLANFRADSCVCLNMLEHVECDAEALQRVRCVLTDQAVIALFVPAFQALYGELDRGLGHFRRYDRAGIHVLAKKAGLVVRKLHYVNMPGFVIWWLNAHFFQRETFSSSQVQAYDRFVIPLISRVEQILPAPFGQSLFAVLEKS
jgi:SAM-dependent methyltransferase